LETGLFQNDVWVGVFGLIAALASWRSGWKATALPPALSPVPEETTASQTEKTALSDSVTDADILSPMGVDGSTLREL